MTRRALKLRKKAAPKCKKTARERVDRHHKRGMAVGAERKCSVVKVVWKTNKKNKWRRVAATTDIFTCRSLHKALLPKALLTTLSGPVMCTNPKGKAVKYRPVNRILEFDRSMPIQSRRDAHKHLKGTPKHFRKFIGKEGRKRYQAHRRGCDSAGVSIGTYHRRGFAAGAYNECGGAMAIWAVGPKDKWYEVIRYQDTSDCKELYAAGVPNKLARRHHPLCYTPGGEVRYNLPKQNK